MMRKLLLSKTKPVQLLLTLLGATLGLCLMMAGIQVYRDTQSMLQQKDMLGGDFIVINKKIGLLNTLSGSLPTFSGEEIQEIKNTKAIDNVGVFSAGNFRSLLELTPALEEMAGPGFRTDLFFESVPNGFVDVDASEWRWKPGDKAVPIIIPSDYIKLYNMAFAQSQGLPIIPESMIKSVTFKLRIKGQGKEELLDARIAGFSQRINSILVPQSFLEWGNEHYGNGQKKNPSRLILHTSDPASPALANFFREKGYELNEEKLKASKVNGILQVVFGIVGFIGVLIIALALLGFMQYNQLLAYRSAYEIQTLHWLGYRIRQLWAPYLRFIAVSVVAILILSVAAFFVGHSWLKTFLVSKGFDMELPSLSYTIVVGVVISLLMVLLSSMAAYRQVAKLAR